MPTAEGRLPERAYRAPDGSIAWFEANTRYVEVEALPDPYPGDVWEFDPLTGVNLPHLTTVTVRYERIDDREEMP